MEPFLIVHHTTALPTFSYASSLEAAISQIEYWLATERDESVKSIAIVYTPHDRVVYHKKLNRPHFFAGLLDIVRPVSQRFKRSATVSATSWQLN